MHWGRSRATIGAACAGIAVGAGALVPGGRAQTLASLGAQTPASSSGQAMPGTLAAPGTVADPYDLRPPRAGDPPASAAQPDVYAGVADDAAGPPLPAGFLGLSLEYQAVRAYTGPDSRAINPALVRLISQLAPGQSPVLRIGGNSTDQTWWPAAGLTRPSGVAYPLTRSWLATTRALATQLHAQLILGINLASGQPALAAAEARALVAGLGRSSIAALEIGNEPDLYTAFSRYRYTRAASGVSRSRPYTPRSLARDLKRWGAALPALPLAGPALAGLGWLNGLSGLLAAQPRLELVTVHRYPLLACLSNRSASNYPTIANLLSDQSATGLAQPVAPYVAAAHARALQIRIDELNSVACSGRYGVSNTFAAALWMLDTLFDFASVGVDGVNVHTLPGAAYAPFAFRRVAGGWQARVAPVYYAMWMFARAFPPGAQLLPVTTTGGPVKLWATRATDGSERIVAINKDSTATQTVSLQGPGIGGPASVSWLLGPSVRATAGVTVGGQAFGAGGELSGRSAVQRTFSLLDRYTITLPPASAALITG